MTLNENRSWPNVLPENGSETSKVNQAFLEGKAEKKLVKSGVKLYRFSAKDRKLFRDDGTASPWWCAVDPFGEFDVGLEGVLKFAKANGVKSTEYARLISAVSEDWNAMDVIMTVELKANVYGFWGQCRQQPKKTGAKVNLTGRAYQLFIPGLTAEHVKEVSTKPAP